MAGKKLSSLCVVLIISLNHQNALTIDMFGQESDTSPSIIDAVLGSTALQGAK
jgi:hypothetical protein